MKIALYKCDFCNSEARCADGRGYPHGWIDCALCNLDACDVCQGPGCSVPFCPSAVVCVDCYRDDMFEPCSICHGSACRPSGEMVPCSTVCKTCNTLICKRCDAKDHHCLMRVATPTRGQARKQAIARAARA